MVPELSRRKMVATLGTAATLAVAGCASDSSDDDGGYEDANGNENSDENGGENGSEEEAPDPEEVENREQGQDVLEFGDLQINEHELIVEESEFSDEINVEGIVENTGDEMFDYVEVGVRIYDPDGHQLDRYMTNTQDLDAGQTWKFEIMVLEDAEDVDDYDIGVQGTQHGF